jgi:hypothetical protein
MSDTDGMSSDDLILAQNAEVIRALGKRVVGDIIEIGRRLTDAKQIAGHGNWLPWLEREFGWGEITALNYMRVHAWALKSSTVEDLDLPMRSLYLLAAPSTSEEVRDQVVARAENGETLSVADVQRIVDEARKGDIAKHENTIADLRAEAQAREDAVRAEYADKLVLSPEFLQGEIAKAIEKAVKPLKRELTAAEKKLEAAKKRLEEKEAADPQPSGPKIDSNISLASTGIRMALDRLASTITITPQQVVEIETLAASATGEAPADRLGKARAEAQQVILWLDEFVSIAL